VRVLLVGPPGAGKGTQAARLAAWAAVPHVATGDMFRQAVRDGSPLGQELRRYMERGALVPDELTVALVRERLLQPDCAGGFVLDGFPRTLPQAEALDRLLAELGRPLELALFLDVPEDVILRRLGGRRVCPACGATYHVDTDPPTPDGRCRRCGTAVVQREDDREETQRRRLAVYRRDTAPLLDYYGSQGKLRRVDGDRPVDEVTRALVAAVGGGEA
jgi:adenylate kinase